MSLPPPCPVTQPPKMQATDPPKPPSNISDPISPVFYQSKLSRSKSLENLHPSHLQVPPRVKPAARKSSLQPVAGRRLRAGQQDQHGQHGQHGQHDQHGASRVKRDSPVRRVSVMSQLSDLIITSRSHSRASNGFQVRERKKNIISCFNLCCIRSVLIIATGIFIVFIYKFYNLINKTRQ